MRAQRRPGRYPDSRNAIREYDLMGNKISSGHGRRSPWIMTPLSSKSWVVAAHVPGLGDIKAKQTIEPMAEALATSIEGYRRRAAASKPTRHRAKRPSDALASVVLVQSSFESFLPLRLRSKRAKSSALGVAIPLSLAMRSSCPSIFPAGSA